MPGLSPMYVPAAVRMCPTACAQKVADEYPASDHLLFAAALLSSIQAGDFHNGLSARLNKLDGANADVRTQQPDCRPRYGLSNPVS